MTLLVKEEILLIFLLSAYVEKIYLYHKEG